MTLDLRYIAEAQETKEKVGKLDLIKTKKFLPFKRPSMIKKKKKDLPNTGNKYVQITH